MFGFLKKRTESLKLIAFEKESYISILETISAILQESENNVQSQFMKGLIELLNQQNYDMFIKRINSVDVWGGAGAVWEVFIKNKASAKEFEKNMVQLINLMEKTQILGTGIKPIRKIFEENLRK